MLQAAILGAAFALSACTVTTELPCPAPKILRDASELTRFAPGQPPSAQTVQYIGKVAETKLSCAYDAKTYERLDVVLGVKFTAERNPAIPIDAADLRYFVAIVNLQGTVLAKKEFPLHLVFPSGSNQVDKVEEIDQSIPLTYPQNGGSLQIWVGFQLSGAELQYNRAHIGG